MEWKPTPSDIAWMKNLINSLNEGGVWGFATEPISYKFYKEIKHAVLLHGDPDSVDCRRVALVLTKYLGWTVANSTN